MLTRLRLKNFKAWPEALWESGVELAPITLFLGPNSAGKTSLLQVPLLLKQTFDSPDRSLDLNLGGQPADLVDVGTFDSVVHQGDGPNSGLGFGFALADEQETYGYEVTYQPAGTALAVERLELRQNEARFTAARQLRGGYLLEAPGYSAKQIGGRPDAKRTFQPERSLAFSAEAIAELGPSGPVVQDLALKIRNAISGIAYLGPLRERPERTYLWSGVDPGSLGKSGERAVHALLASHNTRTKQREGSEGGAQWLVERVSEWLQRLGIADGLVLERQGRSRHYEVYVMRGAQKSNLMDVGFGISQVLPMLVLSHFVPRGATIVAEQPEIHLHPRAQVGLAELMVEVATTRGVQFLAETHSEHLFRRLQYLVADQRIAPDLCRLYFVDRADDGKTSLQQLALDAYGRIANWPTHFFGDSLGETERHMARMMERMMADARSER